MPNVCKKNRIIKNIIFTVIFFKNKQQCNNLINNSKSKHFLETTYQSNNPIKTTKPKHFFKKNKQWNWNKSNIGFKFKSCNGRLNLNE